MGGQSTYIDSDGRRGCLAISTRARAPNNDRDLTHALRLRKML